MYFCKGQTLVNNKDNSIMNLGGKQPWMDFCV